MAPVLTRASFEPLHSMVPVSSEFLRSEAALSCWVHDVVHALTVEPELLLTGHGLVRVNQFVVSLFEEPVTVMLLLLPLLF